jgi:uncharacterized protein
MEFAYVMNCQVLLFNYRGYAYSESASVSEAKLQLDAKAIYDFVIDSGMLLNSNIYLMGKEMGAAVATYMMTECRNRDAVQPYAVFKGLILESAFTDCEQWYRYKTNGWLPKTFLAENRWPTIDRIPRVQVKIMIIHGADDDIIPVEMARQLYRRSAEAQLVLVPFAKHSQLWR